LASAQAASSSTSRTVSATRSRIQTFRAGIEVDAQLVGCSRSSTRTGADSGRCTEVDDPQELRRVAHDDLLRRAARRKPQLHGLDPVGALRGARF